MPRTPALAALVVVVVAAGAERAEAETVTEQRFEAGRRAYRLGEWDKAIGEWSAGFKETGDPLFLYNIAQAHRQKKAWERAAFFYRSYLKAAPAGDQRADAERYLAEAEQAQAAETGAASAPPITASPPPVMAAAEPPPRPRRLLVMAELLVGAPGGDYDSAYVFVSPGVRVAAGWTFLAHLDGHATFRVVPERSASGYSATYLDLGLGLGYTQPLAPRVGVRASADLVWAREKISGDVVEGSGSGLGVAVALGADVRLSSTFSLLAGVGYSVADVSSDALADTTAAWLTGQVGAAARF